MSDKYKFENGVSHRSSCLGSILRKSNHSDSESRKFLNENYPDKNSFSTIDFNDEIYTNSKVDTRGGVRSKNRFKKFPLCNNKAVTCKRFKDYSASVDNKPSYDSSVGRKGQRSSKSCNTETAQMYEVYCQQMRWSRSNTRPRKSEKKRNNMFTDTGDSYGSSNPRKMPIGIDRLQSCTKSKKEQNNYNKKDESYRRSVVNTSSIHSKSQNAEKTEKYNASSQRIISMATVCQHNDGGSCNVSHDESTYGDQDDFLNDLMNDFTITEKNRKSNETFLDHIHDSLMKDRMEEERKLNVGVPSLVSLKNHCYNIDEENKALMNELENLTDCVDNFLDSTQSQNRCVIEQSAELLSLRECEHNSFLFSDFDEVYPDNSSSHLEEGAKMERNILLDELEEISNMVVDMPIKSANYFSGRNTPPPLSHLDAASGLDEKMTIRQGYVNFSHQDKDDTSKTKLSGEEMRRRRDSLNRLRNGNDESRKGINSGESLGNETKLSSPTNGFEYDQLEKKTTQVGLLEKDARPSPINLFNETEDELLLFTNKESVKNDPTLPGNQHCQRFGIEAPPLLEQ